MVETPRPRTERAANTRAAAGSNEAPGLPPRRASGRHMASAILAVIFAVALQSCDAGDPAAGTGAPATTLPSSTSPPSTTPPSTTPSTSDAPTSSATSAPPTSAACAAAGRETPETPASLPDAVRATFEELTQYIGECDAAGANARLDADGGAYIPSHFAQEDIPAEGFLGLGDLGQTLGGEPAVVAAGTGGTPEATTGMVYVWPAAAVEGFLGWMSEADKQQFADEFGEAALEELAGEAFPEPQVRIGEDGRWLLFAQLDG